MQPEADWMADKFPEQEITPILVSSFPTIMADVTTSQIPDGDPYRFRPFER